MRWKSVALIIFILAGYAPARILNVPAEYVTIQAGIDAALSGDTVLVAPGEYHENIIINNKNVLLTSAQGPDATLIFGTCRLQAGLDSTCVIKGLSFVGTENTHGSSLISCWPDIIPKVEGNILRNNIGSTGGAIFAYGGNPIIRGNIIRDNWARQTGGGISLGFFGFSTDDAEISRNVICRNRTGYTVHGDGHGGGIYIIGNARVTYNLIYGNSSFEPLYGGTGGGIDAGQAFGDTGHMTVIAHNTICNNSARLGNDHGWGGGLLFISNGAQDSLYVVNNIFAFNYWGGNVRGQLHDSMYLHWDYNLVYGDTAMGFPHGDHDIYLDPMFADTTAGDYRLLWGSPAIDAGDPTMPLDPDSTRADIGAIFYDQSVGVFDDNANAPQPYSFTLKQNYPNPFNPVTTISFTLNKRSRVSLCVRDITGKTVYEILADEERDAGEHVFIWDGTGQEGKDLATGIYFYELRVDNGRQAKSMIMLK